MIHPSLHDVRATISDQLRQLQETRGDPRRAAEVELHDRYSCRPQPLDIVVFRPQAHDNHFVRNAGLGGDKPRQHGLSTADAKICCHTEKPARPRLHAHRSRQACSMSTFHKGYCQLRVPAMCSCQARRTGATQTKPWEASRAGANSASAHSRNGPRSQASIGTPNPILGRSIRRLGNVAIKHAPQQPFALTAAPLEGERQCPGILDHPMVEQRNAALQAHRHRGAIHLGQNIVGQISDHIEELKPGDEIREIAREAVIPQRPTRLASAGRDLIGPLPLAHHTAVDGAGARIIEQRRRLVQLVARKVPRHVPAPSREAWSRSAGDSARNAAAEGACRQRGIAFTPCTSRSAQPYRS